MLVKKLLKLCLCSLFFLFFSILLFLFSFFNESNSTNLCTSCILTIFTQSRSYAVVIGSYFSVTGILHVSIYFYIAYTYVQLSTLWSQLHVCLYQ